MKQSYINSHLLNLQKIIFCSVGGLLLSCISSVVHAAPFTVGLVLSDQSQTYQTISETIAKELNADNIKLISGKVGEEIPSANLLLVVGTKAADALPISTTQPVLYLLLQRAQYENLRPLGKQPKTTALRSAVYIEQSPERQITFIKLALPQVKNIGILHSAHTVSNLDVLRSAAKAHGLLTDLVEVNEQRTLSVALNEVLEGSDILFAVPDSSIYSSVTVRNLMFSTYRSGKPLIAYAAGYVKAGASAAVFSTPSQFAVQAADMVREYARTGNLPAAQYPKLFDVAVNEDVVRSLGLSIRSANVLQTELERIERGKP